MIREDTAAFDVAPCLQVVEEANLAILFSSCGSSSVLVKHDQRSKVAQNFRFRQVLRLTFVCVSFCWKDSLDFGLFYHKEAEI